MRQTHVAAEAARCESRALMRAVQYERTGPPDVLQMVEVPRPEVGPLDALVRVHATGVNRADILARSGQLPFSLPLPHILGADVVGFVAEKGDAAGGPEVGSLVAVNAYLGCGRCEFCEAGRNNVCVNSTVVGLQRPGGYAEYVAVPAADLIELPEDLAAEAAIPMLVAGVTAWHMLLERGGLRPGDDVLVIGATSGVGSIGVQVARLAGARRVFGTVGTADKVSFAEDLGCDGVVLHSDPAFGKAVRGLTRGRGVDVVLEHVGAATWRGSTDAIARGGRIVIAGGHGGFDVTTNVAVLSAKEYAVVGSYGGTRADLRRLLDAAGRGEIKAVVSDLLPLERAARAHEILESRRQRGKVILQVGEQAS